MSSPFSENFDFCTVSATAIFDKTNPCAAQPFQHRFFLFEWKCETTKASAIETAMKLATFDSSAFWRRKLCHVGGHL